MEKKDAEMDGEREMKAVGIWGEETGSFQWLGCFLCPWPSVEEQPRGELTQEPLTSLSMVKWSVWKYFPINTPDRISTYRGSSRYNLFSKMETVAPDVRNLDIRFYINGCEFWIPLSLDSRRTAFCLFLRHDFAICWKVSICGKEYIL